MPLQCPMRSSGPRLLTLLLVLFSGGAKGAGDVKLWEQGDAVESQPVTVFVMFVMVVSIVVIVETLKHKIEHRTHDPYRLAALNAVYVELMLIGIVSFLLILVAELGMTNIQLGCDDSGSGSSNESSSSSSSTACGIGFSIVLFEYAHFVLFFMSLANCTYIFASFLWRDAFGRRLKKLQHFTFSSWKLLEEETKSFWQRKEATFARKILALRSGMCILHGSKMRHVCCREVHNHETALARLRGVREPAGMPCEDAALEHFSIAKYIKLMYSELAVRLISVPKWVWLLISVHACVNLVHMLDVNLALTYLIGSGVGPLLSFLLLWRLQKKFDLLVELVERHPRIYKQLYHSAVTLPDLNEDPEIIFDARMRSAFTEEQLHEDPWAEETPWDIVKGDGSFWNPGPKRYRAFLLGIAFSTTFYAGELVLLTPLIFERLGLGPLIACWILPAIPLFYVLPQCLLLYTLIFLTRRPSEANLTKTLRKSSPHQQLVEMRRKNESAAVSRSSSLSSSSSYPLGEEVHFDLFWDESVQEQERQQRLKHENELYSIQRYPSESVRPRKIFGRSVSNKFEYATQCHHDFTSGKSLNLKRQVSFTAGIKLSMKELRSGFNEPYASDSDVDDIFLKECRVLLRERLARFGLAPSVSDPGEATQFVALSRLLHSFTPASLRAQVASYLLDNPGVILALAPDGPPPHSYITRLRSHQVVPGDRATLKAISVVCSKTIVLLQVMLDKTFEIEIVEGPKGCSGSLVLGQVADDYYEAVEGPFNEEVFEGWPSH